MLKRLLEVFGLLTVGAVAGAVSQAIPTKLQRIQKIFREIGETELADITAKAERGEPVEDILAEMSPEMRERWEQFNKEKNHG